MENKQLVAVYGSLRKGEGNHSLLERDNAKYIDTIELPSEYTLFSLGSFPGVHLNGENPLTIELYEVDESTLLGPLDFLEGYDPDAVFPEQNFYNRVQIDTEYGKAWLYVYNGQQGEPITHGDWSKYLRELN